MEVPLPTELANRIPAGHVLHRHTGIMERVKTNEATGQSNFILHPIAGEEQASLVFGSGQRVGVTDLPIRPHDGHRVWLFSLIGPSGKIAHFLSWSRMDGSWITLHNQQVNIHLFDQPKLSTGTKLGMLASIFIGAPKVANVLADQNRDKQRTLSATETHELIVDIRTYLERMRNDTPPNSGGRL